jgi:tRNA (adenine57-N1/adenine58-N1)-methyltransferase
MTRGFITLLGDDDRTWVLPIEAGGTKAKGLGVVDTAELIDTVGAGGEVELAGKTVRVLPTGLPELRRGMLRRAQTIGDKDAGILVARLGIGRDDVVLEAGLGSAGLGLHIARSLGPNGHHITVEPRPEHAAAGLGNLERAAQAWADGPTHTHFEGLVEEVAQDVANAAQEGLDVVVLDMADHVSSIEALAPLLRVGGRMACYCPVTAQLERCWEAVEAAGLEVEWAGEIMERPWTRASRGGIRPTNGPFGHTAFLLFAQRRRV